jgi:hypothetical protein
MCSIYSPPKKQKRRTLSDTRLFLSVFMMTYLLWCSCVGLVVSLILQYTRSLQWSSRTHTVPIQQMEKDGSQRLGSTHRLSVSFVLFTYGLFHNAVGWLVNIKLEMKWKKSSQYFILYSSEMLHHVVSLGDANVLAEHTGLIFRVEV